MEDLNVRYFCCNCKEEITGEDCIDDGVVLEDEPESDHPLGHLMCDRCGWRGCVITYGEHLKIEAVFKMHDELKIKHKLNADLIFGDGEKI